VAVAAAVTATVTAGISIRTGRLQGRPGRSLPAVLLLAVVAGRMVYAGGPVAGMARIAFPAHDISLTVEIASTPLARQRGLSGRRGLAGDSGMLFVLKRESPQGIWMKDMQFPLDILWFDSKLRLVGTADNVKPDSYPKIFKPDQPAKYILEVNAGFLAQHPLEPGERMLISPVADR